MKKLFCVALLSAGFVGCSGGASTEDKAKTMSTPPASAPAEGTAPAGDAGKEAAEAPKDPAPAATEAAEAK